jgi:hypothetical protein
LGFTSVAANGNGTVISAASNNDRLIFANTSNIVVTANAAGGKNLFFDLTASGVVAGLVGGDTQIPVLTIDAKGRIKGASNQAINEIVGIAAFGAANSGLLGYSAANTAFNKANGVVQTGYTLVVANGSQSNISPSSNASTMYLGNTGNILFSTTGTQTISAELTTTGVAAGSWGGGSNIASIVVDAMGRITSVSNSAATVSLASTGTNTGNSNWVNVAANGQIIAAEVKNIALSMTFYNVVVDIVPFIGSMPVAGTIQKCIYFTDASTATVKIQNGTTAVTNLSALAVTSSAKSNNATGANSVAVGDKIQANITAVGAATWLSLTLIITPA